MQSEQIKNSKKKDRSFQVQQQSQPESLLQPESERKQNLSSTGSIHDSSLSSSSWESDKNKSSALAGSSWTPSTVSSSTSGLAGASSSMSHSSLSSGLAGSSSIHTPSTVGISGSGLAGTSSSLAPSSTTVPVAAAYVAAPAAVIVETKPIKGYTASATAPSVSSSSYAAPSSSAFVAQPAASYSSSSSTFASQPASSSTYISQPISSSSSSSSATAQQAKDTAAETYEKAKDTVADTYEKAKDTAADTYEKAKDTAADTLEKAKDTAATTYVKAKIGAEQAKESAASSLEQAKDKVANTYEQVKASTLSTIESAKQQAAIAAEKWTGGKDKHQFAREAVTTESPIAAEVLAKKAIRPEQELANEILVVFVDGTLASDKAFSYALKHKQETDVLYFVNIPRALPAAQKGITVAKSLDTTVLDEVNRNLRDQSHLVIQHYEDKIRGLKIDRANGVTLDVASSPEDAAVEFLKEKHANVAFVGTRDLGAVKKMFAGSFSDSLVHNAPCAVMVVRCDPTEAERFHM